MPSHTWYLKIANVTVLKNIAKLIMSSWRGVGECQANDDKLWHGGGSKFFIKWMQKYVSKIFQKLIQTLLWYCNQYTILFIVTCHPKIMILDKNNRYTLAKIEWSPCADPKNCSTTRGSKKIFRSKIVYVIYSPL